MSDEADFYSYQILTGQDNEDGSSPPNFICSLLLAGLVKKVNNRKPKSREVRKNEDLFG
jgi:hypothetical protein